MRVVADFGLCQGHAECTVEAPQVFALSESGQVSILVETPTAEVLDAVRQAVRYCPTHALRIEED
jgi:ferredoxin